MNRFHHEKLIMISNGNKNEDDGNMRIDTSLAKRKIFI